MEISCNTRHNKHEFAKAVVDEFSSNEEIVRVERIIKEKSMPHKFTHFNSNNVI